MQLAKQPSILLYVGKSSHDSPSQCHIALCAAVKHVWHKDFAPAFLALRQLGAFLWIGLQCAVNVFAFPSNLHESLTIFGAFLKPAYSFLLSFPTIYSLSPTPISNKLFCGHEAQFFLEYWYPRLISQQKRCRPTLCISQFPLCPHFHVSFLDCFC